MYIKMKIVFQQKNIAISYDMAAAKYITSRDFMLLHK